MGLFESSIKRDPFFFRAGMLLLSAAVICWIFNIKESYANYGLGLMVIYLLQYAMEILIKNKEAKNGQQKQ